MLFILIPVVSAFESVVVNNDTFIVLNQQRRAQNLSTVVRSRKLDSAANAKLADMAKLHYFDHENTKGKKCSDFVNAEGYAFKIVGENLARGFESGAAVVEAWMQSPSHRQNILDDRYTEVGIASGILGAESGSTSVYVLFMATPSGKSGGGIASVLGEKTIGRLPAINFKAPPFSLLMLFVLVIMFLGVDALLISRIHEVDKDPIHIHRG